MQQILQMGTFAQESNLDTHIQCSPYLSTPILIFLSVSQGFPLIFHGVAGTDERDSNCPSVYNMAEVEVLKEYLKALVDYLHKRGVTQIGPGEIGIIAPYRKQVSVLAYNNPWMY